MWGVWLGLAWSAPVAVPVQGMLSDAGGQPLTGEHALTFRVFRESTSAGEVSSTQTVSFAAGAFAATVSLEPTFLANADLMVAITVGGVETTAVPVGWAPRAGFAVEAGNAAQLGGTAAAAFYRSPSGVPWAEVTGRPAEIVSSSSLLTYIQSSAYDTVADLTTALGSTYLTPASAASTYLSQTTAAATYAAKSGATLDGDVTLPAGTVKLGADLGDPCTDSSHYGRIRWTGSAFQGCTANGWTTFAGAPDGSGATLAARSCKQLNADFPTLPSGTYWLDTDGSTPTNAPFRAWCDMTSGNAGWTLVLKISGSDNETFRYDSAQWTNSAELNVDSTDPAVDANHKNAGFWLLGFTEIRMAMGATSNIHQLSITRSNARDLFTGTTVASTYNRSQFITWSQQASSNWDNQPNCNVTGFNFSILPGTGAYTSCRYGITMNNEADCNTNDSTIGLGCHSNNFSASRYTSAGSSRWSTDQRFPLRGWVWVR